jgi:phospholipase C
MLTPLQEEVAAVIAALEEAKDFALAGGAALIMREQIERGTRDLDFFGLSAAAVDRLVPGFRVPAIVASPFTKGSAKRPRVAHRLFDHTSALKLIEWGVAALDLA